MKTLSHAQRQYFIKRINDTLNKEIGVLEQIHATTIETVANKQFKAYLKETGIGKMMKEYRKKKAEYDKIQSRMENICTSLWEKTEYPGRDSWKPSFYDTKSIEKFLKQICNALAREGFTTTPKGRRLKELEEKKTKAIDVVMGMTETELVVQQINKVLGKGMRLLGNG